MSTAETPTRRARRSVLIAYGVVALFGAAFFALSFQYDFFRYGDQVGPGLLPRIVGALVAVLGLALMLQEVRTGSVLTGDSGIEDEDEDAGPSRQTIIKLVSVFGMIVVAVLLVPLIGLVPPLVLLVLALTIFVEKMPVIPSLISTVVAGVVAFVLFAVVLRLPVPMGIFEGMF